MAQGERGFFSRRRRNAEEHEGSQRLRHGEWHRLSQVLVPPAWTKWCARCGTPSKCPLWTWRASRLGSNDNANYTPGPAYSPRRVPEAILPRESCRSFRRLDPGHGVEQERAVVRPKPKWRPTRYARADAHLRPLDALRG